jgi:hypothetical protein
VWLVLASLLGLTKHLLVLISWERIPFLKSHVPPLSTNDVIAINEINAGNTIFPLVNIAEAEAVAASLVFVLALPFTYWES